MVNVQIPSIFKPLMQPIRYKAAYGGRGSGKSHAFAQMIVIRCLQGPTRVACLREVQQSIRDSVRALIVSKIEDMGVSEYFQVLEAEIRGRNGSLITFHGLRSYNADNIKSLEGIDIAWCEEAQALSAHSLDILKPTIRKPNSELWFSYNPRNPTDAVDVFFRKNPPENSIAIEVNYDSNPFFPKELREEMEHDFEVDPDNAEHVWHGAYSAGKGSILARWINQAERENRVIDDVEFDPEGAPIHISMDLGFRDTTCCWFWQPKLGGYSIFSYLHGTGMDADDWIEEIKKELVERGVTANHLGGIWLPQDAKAKTFQSKHTSAEKFLATFGSSVVKIIPPSRKADQISAARTVIKKVEFHKTRCEDGLAGLRAWEFAYNAGDQVFSRDPKHDWASHRGDSFSYGCQVLSTMKPVKKEEKFVPKIVVGGRSDVSLNDLWATSHASSRI